ncbi:sigma-70 family RNA polymerase sigma factor [Brevundimonas sp.]|uniref:sigma-70 family RNA polymerase sigma factor n=1 Tax=Brevundimonas sp. TaxID=1871086 RepID=UPI002D5589FE|nr:sigma-70 family RNA polymerase sigma factor [Brevundimonas sp.]HYD27273.1 sigma-70 family RNA polymerase sigma factor [Brevundimonas sp.]
MDEHARLIQAVALYRDRAAFSRLFEYFAPRLKAYLMRAGAPAGAAEDFAQDAMLTVWRKADLFDPSRAGAATWIFTIARNRRLDVLRREGRESALPDLDLTPDEPERPDDLLSEAEEAARLNEAMRQLSPDQMAVLRLAFFKGDAHSEIARALDLPLGTVKSRIRKAMIKLRLILEPTRGQE